LLQVGAYRAGGRPRQGRGGAWGAVQARVGWSPLAHARRPLWPATAPGACLLREAACLRRVSPLGRASLPPPAAGPSLAPRPHLPDRRQRHQRRRRGQIRLPAARRLHDRRRHGVLRLWAVDHERTRRRGRYRVQGRHGARAQPWVAPRGRPGRWCQGKARAGPKGCCWGQGSGCVVTCERLLSRRGCRAGFFVCTPPRDRPAAGATRAVPRARRDAPAGVHPP
jgi:hypothetical protein